MQNIDWYLDTARSRNGITSDNKLGPKIGVSSPNISSFRNRKSWPSDETMFALAELAGVPAMVALADLNVWRAKSPRVQAAYMQLAEKLAHIAAMLLIAFGINQAAITLAEAEQPSVSNTHSASLFIMENIMC
jgi:hypothetical protein